MSSSQQPATLITGATGLVGSQLMTEFPNAIGCSRSRSKAAKRLGVDEQRIIEWDTQSTFPIDQVDRPIKSVVNLMGESIAHGRWNDAKKKRIRDSRIQGTKLLVDSLIDNNQVPDVFVSASAIGFYGDTGEQEVDEATTSGSGFLTDVCVEWEEAAKRIAEHGSRVVLLRIGLVIGEEGGAFKEMAPIFRWGVGGNLGSGKQWMAWIHVDDLTGMIRFCLDNDIEGPVNATAPNPVRNSQFTQAMAAAVNRYAILPVPKFAVKLALGEFANSLFFSQRVFPKKALDSGYDFRFTQIEDALQDVANR